METRIGKSTMISKWLPLSRMVQNNGVASVCSFIRMHQGLDLEFWPLQHHSIAMQKYVFSLAALRQVNLATLKYNPGMFTVVCFATHHGSSPKD